MTSALSKQSDGLKGTLTVPGDKSVSHRALMFGAIAHGETIISGLLESEDVKATRSALAQCGAVFYLDPKGNWRIQGVGEKGLRKAGGEMDMGNSGTSTRLLMGLFSGYNVHCTLTGDASLSKRPMGRVIKPLKEMGASFEHNSDMTLPLSLTTNTQLSGISYTLPVASAQVKSAILLAGLKAKGSVHVIENTPTRDHTETMLQKFGAQLDVSTKDGVTHIVLAGGQTLKGTKITVPSDPSSAAFPTVAALITQGSSLRIKNVMMNPTRDGLYKTLIEMGARIEIEDGQDESVDLIVKSSVLQGIEVPAERIPSMIDECPILAVAASFAKGTTKMTGLSELRVKESDRLGKMAAELKACGVALEEGKDWLVIHGNGSAPEGDATIDPALDHRIAMSFLVMGLATQKPVIVEHTESIETSFPGFIELMAGVGADIKRQTS